MSITRQQPITIHYRSAVRETDIPAVEKILSGSDFFTREEVLVAVDLLKNAFLKGEASRQRFSLAESPQGKLLGYACYGRIASTEDRYDLHWLAIEPSLRRHGLGQKLLQHVEELIKKTQGRRVYVQTAGRPLYAPTHAFYKALGYSKAAALLDYYGPGDDQLIFVKEL